MPDARALLDEIERQMLDAPSMIPALREAREQALGELRELEAAEQAEHEREAREGARLALRALQGDPAVYWT